MRNCADILDHGLVMDQMQAFLEHKTSLAVTQFVGRSLADIHTSLNGRVASLYVDVSGFEKPTVDAIKGQLLSTLSQIKGVDLVLLMRRQESSEKPHCSIRCNTDARWDVNRIASHFGGGGHTAASGFSASPETNEPDAFYDCALSVHQTVTKLIESTYLK